jgi:AraC-like DNA-binding protein
MPVMVKPPRSFYDFEGLREGLQDAPMDILQIQRGPMQGCLAHLAIDDDIGVSTARYTRGVQARGLGSDRRLVLSTLTEAGPTTFGSVAIKAGDQMIIQPDTEFRIVNLSGGSYTATFLDPVEFLKHLEAQQSGAADHKLWRDALSVHNLDPETAAVRIRNLQTLTLALSTDAMKPTMPATVTAFHRRNLLELLSGPILDATPCRAVHVASPEKLVRDILHYLDTVGARPVHISEICERFNVEERTLYRHFHSVVGMAPKAYLRIKRLNDVHTELRRDGLTMSVADVASAHGFLEHGRFAGDYRRLFGELPSQTLRRSAHR